MYARTYKYIVEFVLNIQNNNGLLLFTYTAVRTPRHSIKFRINRMGNEMWEEEMCIAVSSKRLCDETKTIVQRNRCFRHCNRNENHTESKSIIDMVILSYTGKRKKQNNIVHIENER